MEDFSKEEDFPPLDSFPRKGFCGDCYEPQYLTPHGESCKNGHGGAPTIDEVPKCVSCDADLKPNAKFCGECGASREEKVEEPESKEGLCLECGAELSSNAKFCGECGTRVGVSEKEACKEVSSTSKGEKKDKVKVPKVKPEEKSSKVKMPAKDEKKSVKVSEKEEEKEEEEEAFDFSTIDPETDWECFGMIEPEHTECKACPYKVKCAEKAGVEL